MKGIRTDCRTGEISEVELQCEVVKEYGRLIFRILNGVTGFEGFCVEDEVIEEMDKHGWCACMGTKNRYDRLEVPPHEMRKAFDEAMKSLMPKPKAIRVMIE